MGVRKVPRKCHVLLAWPKDHKSGGGLFSQPPVLSFALGFCRMLAKMLIFSTNSESNAFIANFFKSIKDNYGNEEDFFSSRTEVPNLGYAYPQGYVKNKNNTKIFNETTH